MLLLFVALLVAGMITRPVAIALYWMYGFHAVLVAPFVAFALTFSLRKGLPCPLAALAITLFACFLFIMSPVMGISAFTPMVLAGIVGLFARESAIFPCLVGAVYGSLFYPCTLVVSLALGVLPANSLQEQIPVFVIAAALGIALACLGSGIATKPSIEKVSEVGSTESV